MVQHIAQMLHNPLVRDYVSLGNGFHVVDFRVPEPLDGAAIGKLKLSERFAIRCLGLMRGSEYLACESGETALRANDKRSEEHTSELQSLMRISYAVFCLKKKK